MLPLRTAHLSCQGVDMSSKQPCGGAADRLSNPTPRIDKAGPQRTLVKLSNAAAQLHQTGHSCNAQHLLKCTAAARTERAFVPRSTRSAYGRKVTFASHGAPVCFDMHGGIQGILSRLPHAGLLAAEGAVVSPT